MAWTAQRTPPSPDELEEWRARARWILQTYEERESIEAAEAILDALWQAGIGQGVDHWVFLGLSSTSVHFADASGTDIITILNDRVDATPGAVMTPGLRRIADLVQPLLAPLDGREGG